MISREKRERIKIIFEIALLLVATATVTTLLYSIFQSPEPVLAQPQDTVYKNLLTNNYVSPGVIIGPVTNIGQSFHQVQMVLSNKPSHTCLYGSTVDSPQVRVYGNYVPDPTLATALVLPGRSTFANATNTLVLQSIGAFPYIYVFINQIDATDCNVVANYTGTLYPSTPIDMNIGFPNIPLNVAGLGSLTRVAQNSTITVANTINLSADIYTLELSNDSTATQAITIACGSTTLFVWNMAAYQSVSIPYTGLPLYKCPINGGANSLTITPGSGSPWMDIQYKFE